MENLISWIGAAGGALVVAAVAVAWWEHVLRTERPPQAPEPAMPRAVSVDVSLDTLHEAPAGDAASRRATLDGALDRMAQPVIETSRQAWIDTRPTVLQSTAPPVEPKTDFVPSAHG